MSDSIAENSSLKVRSNNRLSAYFKTRENSLIWLVAVFVYTICFSFIEDPMVSTISVIGKSHHWLFAIFCGILPIAFLSNFRYTLENFAIKKGLLSKLIYFNFTFGLAATTLLPKEGTEISLVATIVHWIAGFGGIIVDTVVALVFLLRVAKLTNAKFKRVIAIIGAVIASLDGATFVGLVAITKNPQVAKNGIFEIVPLVVAFIAIYFTNHVGGGNDTLAQRDAKESRIEIIDKSWLSAGAYLTLAMSFFGFINYAFIRNPLYYTISMTGYRYTKSFNVVCITLVVAFVLNYIVMFKKNNFKNVFVWALAMVGSVALILCTLEKTSMDNESIGIFHSIGALTFFYFTMAAVLLFYFIKRKESKRNVHLMLGMLGIIILTTVITLLEFLVFKHNFGETGRTGMTEIFPVVYIQFVFFVENFKLKKADK